MENSKVILIALLSVVALIFSIIWAADLTQKKQWKMPTIFESFVGFITDFFDTLGIGSFATTTVLYRFKKSVPDEKIPGTMNVGHSLPTFVQAVAFADAIKVGSVTLILLVGSAVAGAWLGAGIVSRMSRCAIQVGMGSALLVAACLLLMRLGHLFPPGGDALSLSGTKLMIGACSTFIFGALMTIGIGAYAPIMIMVALLGMDPAAAWPIMTGACAFLMPVCGIRFLKADAYEPRASLGLTLAGIFGALVAVYIFKSLPMEALRWLVFIVVVYTGISMLRAAKLENQHSK